MSDVPHLGKILQEIAGIHLIHSGVRGMWVCFIVAIATVPICQFQIE